eukprot:UC1_evm2s548
MTLHYVEQLCANFSHLFHGFGVDKVLGGPAAAVAVGLPLLVHVEQGQVVALRHAKLFALGIAVLFALLGPEEVLVD